MDEFQKFIKSVKLTISSDSTFGFRGKFDFECYDQFGNLKFLEESRNLVTDEGLNDNIVTNFKDGTKKPNWYIGLLGGNQTPAANWTASGVGSQYTELTAYAETERQLWNTGSVSAKTLTNSLNVATFSINGPATVYGAFITSLITKSGNTGVLWCASLMGVARPVVANDIFRVTYTINNQDI